MKIVGIRTKRLSYPCPKPYAGADLMRTKCDALPVDPDPR